MEYTAQTKHLFTRLHYIFLSLIFLGLASIVIHLEMTVRTPYAIGYWNGALAALSALAVLAAAVFAGPWILVLLLSVNVFTILASIIAALTSLQTRGERYIPSYWVCLGILVCSIYSVVIILVKQVLIVEDLTRPNATLNVSQQESSPPHQCTQPPDGFVLPGEVPYLPEYENLSDPPSYREAVDGAVNKTRSDGL